MISFSIMEIQNTIAQFMLPMVRISGFMLTFPIFGSNYIPAIIKVSMIVALTLLMMQSVTLPANYEMFSLTALFNVIVQLIFGLLMGFIFQVLMQAFILAGQVMAMGMGLGFASMVDPQNGVSIPIISQFYVLLFMLLFLSINGHLMAIEALQSSMLSVPVYENPLSADLLSEVPEIGGALFYNALKIALPTLVCLLMINLTLGFMTKAAPQLNIFSIGFPITLVVGVCIIWVSLNYILPLFYFVVDQGFTQLNMLVETGRLKDG